MAAAQIGGHVAPGRVLREGAGQIVGSVGDGECQTAWGVAG